MKKSLLIVLAIGLGSLAAPSAFAGTAPGSGIAGSAHDMGTSAFVPVGEQDAQSRICVYCHTPHNAVRTNQNGGTLAYSPLWNRVNSEVVSYTGYTNGNMMSEATGSSTNRHNLNAVEGTNSVGISGGSLLCMSCHDGVTALNAYSETSGIDQNPAKTGTALIGTTAAFGNGTGDMSNHHPMGFNYQMVIDNGDNEIASVDTPMLTDGTTIGDLLNGGIMECATCHDVHNSTDGMGANFVWKSDDNSAFCLTCHLK